MKEVEQISQVSNVVKTQFKREHTKKSFIHILTEISLFGKCIITK